MARTKAIETPHELKLLFQDYCEWVNQNPYRVHDFKGKDATEVHMNKQRPITWSGFEAWLAKEEVVHHLGHYEQNSNNAYTEFLPTIARIKAICSGDIIDGALAGVYNQNLAARIEGLTDKRELDKRVTKVNFTDGAG